MSEELLACPWCGTVDHLAISKCGSLTGDMPDRPYRVACNHIDHDQIQGPVAYGRYAAIAAWNTRAAPQITEPVGVDLRQKLRMVISHASGGHLSEPEDVDRSINDICVQISAHKNDVWKQAQASALAALSAQPQQAVDVEVVARAMFAAWPTHAVSPALAEQSGQEIGSPLTYDKVLEIGGDHNGLLRLAEAAIAAMSRPVADVERGWQPIESAPKDGTLVLLFQEGDHFAGAWQTDDECWAVYCGQFVTVTPEPEYWQPLPEPPKALSSLREVPGAEAGG